MSRQTRRSNPSREPLPRVLIVCEGEKTERTYFEELRLERCLSPKLIVVVGGGGEPRGLLDKAKVEADGASRKGDAYDAVWCVMDTDQHAHLQTSIDTIKRRKRYRAAVSCPCFEVWLLAHFSDSTAALKPADAKASAERRISAYPVRKGLYAELLPRQQTAFDNAQRLRDHHERAGSALPANPSTDVDQLVGELLQPAGER